MMIEYHKLKIEVMNRIISYECEHCKKILKSYSGMWKHENICFDNPATKSCKTCDSLSFENFINGKLLTKHQENILAFKLLGTFHISWDTDPESDGCEFNSLNEEYQYLYDAEPQLCCSVKKQNFKLCTNCNLHNNK